MTDKLRPYLFYDVAISICATCYRRVDAKIVFEDGKVWMLKRCPQHGHARVLVADDVEWTAARERSLSRHRNSPWSTTRR